MLLHFCWKKAAVTTALMLLPAALMLTGCFPSEPSDAVSQDRIFTEYDLHYDTDSDVTTARAGFKFGNITGTQLELSENSEVLFNGETLTKVVLHTTYYELKMSGLVSSGTFTFVDEDGNRYENSVSLPSIDFPDQLSPISQSTSYRLNWIGSPLEENEEVNVWIYKVSKSQGTVFHERGTGATGTVLGRAQLGGIDTGEATIGMERKKTNTSPDETPEAGGILIARFTPASRTVQVVE